MELHWADVTDDTAVVATRERGWIVSRPGGGPFEGHSDGECSAAAARQLLDAALTAGRSVTSSQSDAPALTEHQWAFQLCQSYQTTAATERLIGRLARRFDGRGHAVLAAWARDKADEERGHHLLALADLRSLGYDADALVGQLTPRRGKALAAYFEAQVDADDPIRAVGYTYALERLSLDNTAEHVTRVEAALPQGVRATRCLRVHSALGSDADHVEDMVALVASLSADERAEVVVGVYETAVLASDFSEDDSTPPADLIERLQPFRNRQTTTEKAMTP